VARFSTTRSARAGRAVSDTAVVVNSNAGRFPLGRTLPRQARSAPAEPTRLPVYAPVEFPDGRAVTLARSSIGRVAADAPCTSRASTTSPTTKGSRQQPSSAEQRATAPMQGSTPTWRGTPPRSSPGQLHKGGLLLRTTGLPNRRAIRKGPRSALHPQARPALMGGTCQCANHEFITDEPLTLVWAGPAN
jgi:hypothetical protein